jgi:hypothetical protein
MKAAASRRTPYHRDATFKKWKKCLIRLKSLGYRPKRAFGTVLSVLRSLIVLLVETSQKCKEVIDAGNNLIIPE